MARDTGTDFTLDDQPCFVLYHASRAMTAAYRTGLAPLGVSYTQYVVLLLLWEHESLPMATLCERLHLDSATLSPLLARLEARGLVARERRDDDERAVDVSCTPAGHALRDRVRTVQSDVEAATGLGADELAALREDLHRVADRLRSPSDGNQPVAEA